MKEKIFVLSGNISEFQDYRKQHEDIADQLTYISNYESLRGFQNPEGIAIGTWKERPDIGEILRILYVQMTNHEKRQKVQNLGVLLQRYQDSLSKN